MKQLHIPAFINRKNDIIFLQEWISEKPNQILFLYGPKSSGKTTLLYQLVTRLSSNKKQFEFKILNLREILINNYKDFIQIFFGVNTLQEKGDIKETREYNTKIFKLKVEVLKGIYSKELDPFKVMKRELEKLNNNKIMPVIIIDELQSLENIYLNGQRELIKELFNFFVSITKETHLAHVIISSSDGFFIDRIYTDSKLSKTSHFLEIDYLGKEDVLYWLNNLKKESNLDLILSQSQIKAIWKYFGGSVWEISKFLTILRILSNENKVSDEDLESAAIKEIKSAMVRFEDYQSLFFHDELFIKINSILQTKDHFIFRDLVELFDRKKLREELCNLVRHNFFSYNPTTGKYKPQGHSVLLGLEWFCKII